MLLKADPDIYENGKRLPIVEEFYSLQGEGYHMGKAAYFLRIGGCDIGCAWCDTKFSWNSAIHPILSVDNVIKNIMTAGASSVVITGGEPLMYDLDYLCRQLKINEIETYLETSGAYPLSGSWNWICLSPKIQQPPLNEIFRLANELKVIISNPDDIDWAIKNSRLVEKSCKLYLQPEWSVYKEILPVIINFVKSNPVWSVSLQAHKFMHIP